MALEPTDAAECERARLLFLLVNLVYETAAEHIVLTPFERSVKAQNWHSIARRKPRRV